MRKEFRQYRTACKNPNAVNYDGDPAAIEDFSCKYLFKNQGNCHLFSDYIMAPTDSKSFTLSYSMKGGAWVFFHDYVPDMYIHTRENLYSLSGNTIRKHNDGPPGSYGSTVKPFFIDVVFKADFDLILETVNWMTEFLDNQTDQPFSTLTHISIWNSHQHTGKIPLDKILDNKTFEIRKTQGMWVFDDFRNILLSKGPQFLMDIFHDYALVPATANEDQGWYRKELLNDSWFCVRFEFDNTSGKTLVLHDTTVQAIKSDR